MKKTCYYKEQRTYSIYDSSHIIGYLNEEVVENYTPEGAHGEGEEQPEPWPVAYKYTGSETDGGTVMPCSNPDNYGDLANAIIRSKYSESQELAIHRHANNGDYSDDSKEYDDYNAWCNYAVSLAKQWTQTDE